VPVTICTQHHGPRFQWLRWNGLDVLAIENERVRVVVWPGHGADILEFRDKRTDLDALWKNPRVWPPRPLPLGQPHSGRSELYDVFHGGWFVSAPNGFHPGEWPSPGGAPLGCHGELHSVPWDVSIVRCDASEIVVRACGRGVRTPLRLDRIWTLRACSPVLEWDDTLHNEASVRLPFAWQHHPAFGGPLIDGAKVLTNARTVSVPTSSRPELSQLEAGYRGAWPHVPCTSGPGLRDCSVVPAAGSPDEHVVHLEQFPYGWGAIWNESLQTGFGLRWEEAVFPYCWSWACGRGSSSFPLWGSCHTITLQPSTSPLLPFDQLVESGGLAWLEPGARLNARLSTGFIRARAEVFHSIGNASY